MSMSSRLSKVWAAEVEKVGSGLSIEQLVDLHDDCVVCDDYARADLIRAELVRNGWTAPVAPAIEPEPVADVPF